MAYNEAIIRRLIRSHGAFSVFADERGNEPYIVTWETAFKLFPGPRTEIDRLELMRTGTKKWGATVSAGMVEVRGEDGSVIQSFPLAETDAD